MRKYIIVGWPEIQDFMEHSRWDECIFCDSTLDHEVGDSTYAVPEDLYNEVYNIEPKSFLTEKDKETIKEALDFISMAMFELEFEEEDEEYSNNDLEGRLSKLIED